MNLRRQITELVRIMREEDLSEVEVRRWFSSIRIRRPGGEPAAAGVLVRGVHETAPAAGPGVIEAGADDSKNLVPIKSPMVGTFYRSPAPDADPYVEQNSYIDVGQTVCIVEAMKLMNEIESDVKGRIARILVENAQPVEYGQVLFLVETDGPAERAA
ncbi:MAG TPA: acetyl-CoA carboxylase biotin carboxyl carrier protein [Candidatus Limnocylindrales bacterium]|nr:acetyl-CoA carboxylase biotin carboxyl carrier protein [Candidatus Limnocylindrales bacterium]